MLRVEIIDEHGKPLVIPCSRVVIRDHATATPLAVAMTFAERGVQLSKVGDADFQQVLQSLRISDTVLLTKLDAKKLRHEIL